MCLRLIWIFIGLWAFSPRSVAAQEGMLGMEETALPPLPVTGGVSAPFAGICKGWLLVGGGCNFPGRPAAEGGTKCYYDGIYALKLPADGKYQEWQKVATFPRPVAYGASVSTAFGMVCIGGMNADAMLSQVFLIDWDAGKETPKIKELPSLPFPLDNFSATVWNDKVYAAGGNKGGIASNVMLCLDMKKLEKGWTELPEFPGRPRVQPVIIAQRGELYLAGGYDPGRGTTAPEVAKDMLVYSPRDKKWKAAGVLALLGNGSARTVSGGCGAAYGKDYLLFAGGVNYSRFLTALERTQALGVAVAAGDEAQTDSLKAEAKAYMLYEADWYGFNPELLLYDVREKRWHSVGTSDALARAGAGIAIEGNKVYILNGELKPGVRTPEVNLFSIF